MCVPLPDRSVVAFVYYSSNCNPQCGPKLRRCVGRTNPLFLLLPSECSRLTGALFVARSLDLSIHIYHVYRPSFRFRLLRARS